MSKFTVSKNLKYKDLEDAFAETEEGDALRIVGLWSGNSIFYKKNNEGVWVRESSGRTTLPKMYEQDKLVSDIYETMTGPNAYRTVELCRKHKMGFYVSLRINRG